MSRPVSVKQILVGLRTSFFALHAVLGATNISHVSVQLHCYYCESLHVPQTRCDYANCPFLLSLLLRLCTWHGLYLWSLLHHQDILSLRVVACARTSHDILHDMVMGQAIFTGCRLNRGQASLPSILLHVLFFLPTSINAAWLSVASGLGVLIVPLSYGHTAHLEAAAAVTAAVATAAGMPCVVTCVI